MELIPIEYFINKFEVDINFLKDLCLEDVRVCFTEQELKSVMYHLRTLKLAQDAERSDEE